MTIHCSFPQFLTQIGLMSQEILSKQIQPWPNSPNPKDFDTLQAASNIPAQTLASHYKQWQALPQIDVSQEAIEEKQLPKKLALQHHALILKSDTSNTHRIALSNPSNIDAIKAIKRQLKGNIITYLANAQQLKQQLAQASLKDDTIGKYAKLTSIELLKHSQDQQAGHQQAPRSDQNIISQLLNHIFAQALELDATDIHIEHSGDKLEILYRVSTLLTDSEVLPAKISDALRQKFIMLGKGDIVLTQKTQDLGFRFKLPDQILDVRFSYLPTLMGYSIVMRLIKGAFHSRALSSILHDKTAYEQTLRLLQGRQGLFLVTGPTGSGKSTLLYAMLNHMIAQGAYKVITMEDPVEATLPGANQVAINAEVGMDFADVIRSALRQDPDILMIGEIRDPITARMACRAAMTGIMVMASLHTQNAIGTIGRLIDLDAPPFIIGTGIRSVVATRLAQTICPHCKIEYKPTESETAWLKRYHFPTTGYQHGQGCIECNSKGNKGMTSLYEMLVVKPEMKTHLYQRDINAFNDAASASLKDHTLADNAINMAQAGIISFKEAMKTALEFYS